MTATGRLSSSDPNLQNIPVRTEEGREIRSAFVPGEPKAGLLLAADYSQIELRILAHYTGDEQLCEAFARDEDIHARVASQVNGVPLDAGHRRHAAAGQGGQFRRDLRAERRRAWPSSWASSATRPPSSSTPISQTVSRASSSSWSACWPNAARQGYVTTILGRRRAIQGVRDAAGRTATLPSGRPSTRSSKARRPT